MPEIEDRTKIPLKRVIGLPTSILLVAGIMIGSGVFKKIAPMSRALMSEHYILWVWVAAGVDYDVQRIYLFRVCRFD
jgi:hypothetical protein